MPLASLFSILPCTARRALPALMGLLCFGGQGAAAAEERFGEDIYAPKFQWNRMETALLDLRLLGVEDGRPLARIIRHGAPVYLSAGGKRDARATPVPVPD